MNIRTKIKKHLPWPALYLYRKIYYFPKDISAAIALVGHSTVTPTTFGQRLHLVLAFYRISYGVDCPHTENELLRIAIQILNLPPSVKGVIAEAGAYYGGSTAKLSLVGKLCNRSLE